MAKWKREPEECQGSYFFSGQFYVTRGVADELTSSEILSIYRDVQTFVQAKKGIDYLQVYMDEQGRKLYLIDQLSKEMIASGQYRPEDNHCTLLWAYEY